MARPAEKADRDLLFRYTSHKDVYVKRCSVNSNEK